MQNLKLRGFLYAVNDFKLRACQRFMSKALISIIGVKLININSICSVIIDVLPNCLTFCILLGDRLVCRGYFFLIYCRIFLKLWYSM